MKSFGFCLLLLFFGFVYMPVLSRADGLDAYVYLLLHADNPGNSNFVDSSNSGNSVSAVGSVIGSSVSKFGLGSASFTGGYLSVPGINLGDDLFTVDFRSRFNVIGKYRLMGNFDVSGGGWMITFDGNGSYLEFYGKDGVDGWSVGVGWSPSVDVWYHVAIVRSVGNMFFFVDGVLKETVKNVTNKVVANSPLALWVGNVSAYPDPLNGYMDELRISKGVARWNTNFTPPLFPYDSSTPTPIPTPTSTPDQGTSTVVPTSANVDTGGLSLITASILGFFGIIWGIRKLILLLNRS